jgi:hypothetical protein
LEPRSSNGKRADADHEEGEIMKERSEGGGEGGEVNECGIETSKDKEEQML